MPALQYWFTGSALASFFTVLTTAVTLIGTGCYGWYRAAKTEMETAEKKAKETANVSIQPAASADPTDPFAQQFAVTNLGPNTIYDVWYMTSLTDTPLGEAGFKIPGVAWVSPGGPHIEIVHVGQTIGINPDFFARLQAMTAVRVEFKIFYRMEPAGAQKNTNGQQFTGRRIGDKFVWFYG